MAALDIVRVVAVCHPNRCVVVSHCGFPFYFDQRIKLVPYLGRVRQAPWIGSSGAVDSSHAVYPDVQILLNIISTFWEFPTLGIKPSQSRSQKPTCLASLAAVVQAREKFNGLSDIRRDTGKRESVKGVLSRGLELNLAGEF